MSAAASLYDHASARRQRAEGRLRLGFATRAGNAASDRTSALATLYQQGCLKARFPRPEDAAWPEALVLNLSGGVAGGDDLESAITLGENTRAIIASPAAERFYRALTLATPARVATAITLAPGARLEWLPQESILFDGCAVSRHTEITLAGDAVFLGAEMLVFGRAAMGERLTFGRVHDTIRLSREKNLQLLETTRLSGDIAAILSGGATAGSAAGTALLIYAGFDAGAYLSPLRHALAGLEAGASLVLPDLLIARILAPNAWALRRAVVAGLQVLRDHRRMPRVWQG